MRYALREGENVCAWNYGEIYSRPFDVEDVPMAGEMDALFFASPILHEYPCRTEFLKTRKGKIPEPFALPPSASPPPPSEREAENLCRHAWLPFNGGKLDFSGFWFRPTHVGAWAETWIYSPERQDAEFIFSTCGGAVIFLNDEKIGFVAEYKRNYETKTEFSFSLVEGWNNVRVWFDDLCERDARFFVALELIEGKNLEYGIFFDADIKIVKNCERILEKIRFSQSNFIDDDIEIIFPEPVVCVLEAKIHLSGDMIGCEQYNFDFTLQAGENKIVIPIEKIKSGFWHIELELRHEDFAASRRLGVEAYRSFTPDEAPPDILQRADEVLAPLAHLWGGGVGGEVFLLDSLPAIENCFDCADFLLVPLLWRCIKCGDKIDEELRNRIDAAILKFRYWTDEPGNDVMWFFSENHALLFHTACALAGGLFPESRFARSGRLGKEQREIGLVRLRAWFDHFEKCEMAEWNSATYFPVDLNGLTAIYSLVNDEGLKNRAEKAIKRLVEIVMRSSHNGLLTASQGRSYEHSLCSARSLEISGLARLVSGKGYLGGSFHALPQLALCVKEGLRFEPEKDEKKFDVGVEWKFCQGENKIAKLYHYKTRDFAMGSVADYRPGQPGYQETVLHLRLGDKPEAQIWINHPGEILQSGFARPSYWGGCATLPRVWQYKGLALVEFSCKEGTVPFTHAWVPRDRFDEVLYRDGKLFVRGGGACAVIIGKYPIYEITEGPTAFIEARQDGRDGFWLVQLQKNSDCDNDPTNWTMQGELNYE